MYIKQGLGADPMTTFATGVSKEAAKKEENGWEEPVKGILTGVLSVFTGKERAKGEAAAYKAGLVAQPTQPGGAPKWILPLAIGGGALVLVLALRS